MALKEANEIQHGRAFLPSSSSSSSFLFSPRKPYKAPVKFNFGASNWVCTPGRPVFTHGNGFFSLLFIFFFLSFFLFFFLLNINYVVYLLYRDPIHTVVMLLFYFASVKEKHDVIERAFAYANCFQIRLYQALMNLDCRGRIRNILLHKHRPRMKRFRLLLFYVIPDPKPLLLLQVMSFESLGRGRRSNVTNYTRAVIVLHDINDIITQPQIQMLWFWWWKYLR